MKKKVLLLVMSLCLLTLIGGCKKKDLSDSLNTGDTTGSNTITNGPSSTDASANVTPSAAPSKGTYKASDYVTLGQYKGVQVTVAKKEVTDADIDAEIQKDLKANATTETVTDRPVQNGDTVNIDYEGLKDGVAFDGGTAQGYDLEIGSGTFIPGFEEGLIGAKVGDKVAVNVTFPADYQSADLAGQPVVFNVTVNSISKSVLPELTDDYVKTNTDYDSIQAYKDAKRAQLQSSNDEQAQQDKSNNVLQSIIDSSTFSSIPQSLIDYYAYSYRTYNEQMINYFYGTTLEDYLKQQGVTMDDFNKQVQEIATSYSKAELVKKAIAETEGMQITDADYQTLLPEYMKSYGVDTEDTLRQYETKEESIDNMLMQKAMDFAVSQAVVTETAATPTPAAAE